MQGTVRRLHFAAPASSELGEAGAAAIPVNARIAVLFGTGSCGVWELDSSNELRPVSNALFPFPATPKKQPWEWQTHVHFG